MGVMEGGSMATPEEIVQRQLDSYNAKDLEAWLATYAQIACLLL